MRGRRMVVAMALAGTSLLVMPAAAVANGGAYLEFDQTHYLPGEAGRAVSYVAVPARKKHLLEQGPFYVYALPSGTSLTEGRPIPVDAIRLGTLTIEEEKDLYELVVEFTVPQIAPGFHQIGVCNDPCSISGFRESLEGTISVVATRREAHLLSQNETLRGRLFGVRREARKAERRVAAAEGELETQTAFGASERERMTAEIERLETQLAAARELAAARSGRMPFEPWLVGAILLVTLVAAALAFRRRRMLPAMTDVSPPGRSPRRDTERPPAASSEVRG